MSSLTTVIHTDSQVDKTLEDLYAIEKVVNQKLGKLTEEDVLSSFEKNDTYSEEARAIAVTAVRGAYENNPFGLFSYQHSYNAANRIMVARLRFSRLG